MKLDRKIKKDSLLKKMKGFSGAEVKAVCTEAGYFAIRNNRTRVNQHDFLCAIDKIRKEEVEGDEFIRMFG